nr:hypothetical protein [Tanacetum cinerariifolium]
MTRPRAILVRGVLLNPVLHLAFATEADARLAATQHLCLCRNEDILLPSEPRVLSEAEFVALPGFELRSTEGPIDGAFLVGYNRFAEGAPMYGRLEITGNPTAKPVKAAAEAIAAQLGYDVQLAGLGAALHDLGKAHPHFQAKIYGEEISLHEQFPHRHELSSLGFLPLFNRADWPDARDRGILDLHRTGGPWIANHLLDWENWSADALALLAALKVSVPLRQVTRPEAEAALRYAVEHCRTQLRSPDWSAWR